MYTSLIHIHMYSHICSFTFMFKAHSNSYTNTFIHIYSSYNIHIYSYLYIHTYIVITHALTHTHTHRHTSKQGPPEPLIFSSLKRDPCSKSVLFVAFFVVQLWTLPTYTLEGSSGNKAFSEPQHGNIVTTGPSQRSKAHPARTVLCFVESMCWNKKSGSLSQAFNVLFSKSLIKNSWLQLTLIRMCFIKLKHQSQKYMFA